MRRRSPSLDWIKTVLANPEPRRDDPPEVVLISDRDERRARLIPDSEAMDDVTADLDTDLAEDPIEK
jgi:hypothetical protein